MSLNNTSPTVTALVLVEKPSEQIVARGIEKKSDFFSLLQKVSGRLKHPRKSIRELHQGSEKTLRITQECLDALAQV